MVLVKFQIAIANLPNCRANKWHPTNGPKGKEHGASGSCVLNVEQAAPIGTGDMSHCTCCELTGMLHMETMQPLMAPTVLAPTALASCSVWSVVQDVGQAL